MKQEPDRVINDFLKEKRIKMIEKIKQYSLLKQILDRNSWSIALSKDTLKQAVLDFENFDASLQTLMLGNFKTLDCKLLNNAF